MGMSLEKLVGSVLYPRMKEKYEEWVRDDCYGFARSSPRMFPESPASLREFLNGAISLCAKASFYEGGKASQIRLDMTLEELCAGCVGMNGERLVPLSDILVLSMVAPHLSVLVSEALSARTEQGLKTLIQRSVQASACGDIDELMYRLQKSAGEQHVLQWLLEPILRVHGNTQLIDFYRRKFSAQGFKTWWPGACTEGIGEPMEAHFIECPSGVTVVNVSRYEVEDSHVQAYEWSAELLTPPADPEAIASPVLSAVACGMVYVLPRSRGRVRASVSNLRWASDAVSDTDANQMLAFLAQTPNPLDLIDQGDLCFVWLWERSATSERGQGSEVLLAAMKDLRKRFRKLKNLVFNLESGPVLPPLPEDPPQVQVEREESCEAVEQLVRSMLQESLLGSEPIFVRAPDLDADETLRSLCQQDAQDRHLDDGAR